MRAQMFKLGGVTSEKEFYEKFPTEEAFMAKHGKAFRKAQMGAYIGGEKTSNPQMMNFNQYYDQVDTQVTGTNNVERAKQAYQQQMLAAQKGGGGGKQGGGIGDIMGMVSQGMEMFGKKAQFGVELPYPTNQWNTPQQTQMQLTPIQTQMGGYQPMQGTQGQGIDPTMVPGAGPNGGPLGVDTGGQGKQIGNAIAKAVPFMGKAAGIISKFKQEKKDRMFAEQGEWTSDLVLAASKTKPEQTQRKYSTPWDNITTGEAFFPVGGVGTNVLGQVKHGGTIKKAKNGTKIENTYAPFEYDNMASGGSTPFDWQTAGQVGGSAAGMAFNNNAGSQTGHEVAGIIKKIPGVGPIAGAILDPVLTIAGGMLGGKNARVQKNAEEAQQRNILSMSASAMGQGMAQQYNSFVREGGTIPYRTGGGINQNEGTQMERNGELELYNGDAETLSYNPALPEGGESIGLNGPSHEDDGIKFTYGKNGVEAEGGEFGVKLENGGDAGTNFTVFGDLFLNKKIASLMGDEELTNIADKYNGKKIKGAYKDITNRTNTINKRDDKLTKDMADFEPLTTFDKLKGNSFQATKIGNKMNYDILAKETHALASYQEAINKTAEETGANAAILAQKGEFKFDKAAMKERIGKHGKSLPIAEEGITTPEVPIEDPIGVVSKKDYDYLVDLYDKAKNTPGKRGPAVEFFQKEFSRLAPNKAKQVLEKSGVVTNYGKKKGLKTTDLESNYDGIFGERTEAYRASLGESPVETATGQASTSNKQTWNADGLIDTMPVEPKKAPLEPVEPIKRSWMMDAYNQALPFLRPTDQEKLDINQLTGEMYSLMNNKLEPVQAQSYQPQLDVPYDISLQEMRNENQADFRSMQKMVGGNPTAQANLAGQKYLANQKVGAEEFRLNQTKKDQVYSGNRATMNDAQLKNLAIYDTQYTRQEQAKSNTKADTLAALSSMSDKYAKNKLENRQLGIYENMYNYRYDSNGRAVNMNPLFQGLPSGGTGEASMSDAEKELYYRDQADVFKDKRNDEKKQREKDMKAAGGIKNRNGGSINSQRNSSIVKALKDY